MRLTETFLLVLALTVCRSAFPGETSAPPPNKPEAAVNLARVASHIITDKELETFFKIIYVDERLSQQLKELAPLHREQLLAEGRKMALTELIELHLVLAEANVQLEGNSQAQEAINRVVNERLRKVVGESASQMAAHNWMRERGLTLKEWKDVMRDAVLAQSYLWENLHAQVRVSPAEIRQYYESRPDEFRTPRRIVYRVILIDPTGCEKPDEERARAEMVLKRIKEGEDFAALADQWSLDRDRFKGGLRQIDAPPTPPDWLPPLCAGLQPGQCSEVLKTESGYCIVKLERIEPPGLRPFEEAQSGIAEKLRMDKMETARQALLAELRKKNHVELFPEGRRLLGQQMPF
jgi:hypothetical protein